MTVHAGALQRFSIPEAVTGGLVIAIVLAMFHNLAALDLDFVAGDILLLAFFSTVGLNARLQDLAAGGRPLVILLTAAVLVLILENGVGVAVAVMFGAPPAVGMMAGSIALIGGHGTASAWATSFEQISPAASTIGVATATLGLVAGGLVGGPLGSHLIGKGRLRPSAEQGYQLNLPQADEPKVALGVPSVLASILCIAIAILLGEEINTLIAATGLRLPPFVTALFAGIVIGNFGPVAAFGLGWPMHTPAMGLIAGLALNLFLVRAMMSLELWTVITVARPLVVVMVCQVALIVLFSYAISSAR